ncbi:MAG: hypothetical protein SFU86_23965 [Pirellulaceae bacterium]|nr:hypothetical protein [Pirellulaceae bacterium]
MESLDHLDSPGLDLPRLCWRHKGKMLLTGTAVIGLTLAYLSLAPRTFVSEAKLFVPVGRESTHLDPTATTGQFVAVTDSRETEIAAVEELLTSRVLAEKVVDKFTPAMVLERDPNAGPSLADRLSFLNDVNLNPLRVYSIRDKAILAFQESLKLTTGKKTSVIALAYESGSAELARDLLESLVQFAQEEHLRVNRTSGSLEFFDRQSNVLRQDLADKEEELRHLKDSTGLASLTSQREIQLEQIGNLEADLLKAQAERDATRAEIERRRKQLLDSPAMIVSELTTGQPNTPRLSMREKLYELEVKEKELASKLLDNAPLLIQIRSQIAEARQLVEKEEHTTQSTKGVNPVRQAAELALQEKEAALVALDAQTASLSDKIATGKESLKKINEHEVQLVSLEREIELARLAYRRYAESAELARIDSEIHNAKISSLVLMQPPSLSLTPANPSPKATLALGLLAAVGLSFGVALLAERSRSTNPARAATTVAAREPALAPAPIRPRRGDAVPANPR